MPRIDLDEWISSQEAAAILTANSGHDVAESYVRRLAGAGVIRTKKLHNRMSLYNRADAERYTVQKRPEGRKTQAAKLLQDAVTIMKARRIAENTLNALTVEGVPLKEFVGEQQFENGIERFQQILEQVMQEEIAAKEAAEPDEEA